MKNDKVLVFGATGMLGHKLFTLLSERENLEVFATARSKDGLSRWFAPELLTKILGNVDTNDFDSIERTLAELRPNVVINCIGIIKQLPAANDPIISIAINSLFPHRLALACKAIDARMIHISTDCVFSGDTGNYTESDLPDATDLYGRTKLLGEVEYFHCVTLRTSIVGHELKGKHGLIEWFLSQQGKVRGFTRAVYSGFPTVELARIIADFVIPNCDLIGLYHVSSAPISKYDLLKLVVKCYGKQISIEPYDNFFSDRSLVSGRFRSATGYKPAPWPELVAKMYEDAMKNQYR